MARRHTDQRQLTDPSDDPTDDRATPNARDVAVRAYQLYEAHGGTPGADLDDWLRAERELSEVRAEDASEPK